MATRPPGDPRPVAPRAVALWRTRDPEQAQQIGTGLYYPHQLRVHGDARQFGFDLRAARLGALTMGCLAYRTEVEVRTTEPLTSAYEINVPLHGRLRTAAGPDQMVVSPQLGAVTRPDRPSWFRGWDSPCRLFGLKIERDALEAELGRLLVRPVPRPIRFDTGLDLTAPGARQWWALLCSVADRLWDDDTADGLHPLVRAPLEHSLLVGLLLAAGHDHRGALDGVPPAAGATALRRAQDHIDGHLHLPLTVAAIADAAGVGVRTLQHAFQTSLGTTPLRYVRERRLQRVRRELDAASPDGVTVAEIAARWGFTHLGRFGQDYRRAFGEPPSATLHGTGPRG